MAAGRFPGHAFVETLLEHQVSLPLLPRLALDMLRGCAYSEQVSSLRKRVPVRPLGQEENTIWNSQVFPVTPRDEVTCDETLSADRRTIRLFILIFE